MDGSLWVQGQLGLHERTDRHTHIFSRPHRTRGEGEGAGYYPLNRVEVTLQVSGLNCYLPTPTLSEYSFSLCCWLVNVSFKVYLFFFFSFSFLFFQDRVSETKQNQTPPPTKFQLASIFEYHLITFNIMLNSLPAQNGHNCFTQHNLFHFTDS